MTDETPLLARLNRAYVEATGLNVPLSMTGIWLWRQFAARGFTGDDLRLVVGHLRRKVKDRQKLLSCLRLQRLLGDLDYFAEDLAEARALLRRPQVNASKETALGATGRRVEPAQDDFKPVAAVIASSADIQRLIAGMRKAVE